MRKSLIAIGLGFVLVACSDPLADVPKVADVELSQTDAAASALPSDAEVAREGFLGTDAATAQVAGVTQGDAAVAEAAGQPQAEEVTAPKRTGLLGVLRRAVPRARDTDAGGTSSGGSAADPEAAAIADAVATSQQDVPDPAAQDTANAAADAGAGTIGDTQVAALAPPAPAAEPAPQRRGLFGRRAAPKADAPRTGPDAREASYGTILPFGVVSRVCEAKGKSLGQRVEKAPARGFALYDSSVGSAGARTWYLTGFSDGCPRQLTGANVLLGSAGLYEQLHYGPGGENLPYGETDKAYEQIKRNVCGARKNKPCGSKISTMEKSTFFVSAYERFGNSSRWTELLIHDGAVISAAVKPN